MDGWMDGWMDGRTDGWMDILVLKYFVANILAGTSTLSRSGTMAFLPKLFPAAPPFALAVVLAAYFQILLWPKLHLWILISQRVRHLRANVFISTNEISARGRTSRYVINIHEPTFTVIGLVKARPMLRGDARCIWAHAAGSLSLLAPSERESRAVHCAPPQTDRPQHFGLSVRTHTAERLFINLFLFILEDKSILESRLNTNRYVYVSSRAKALGPSGSSHWDRLLHDGDENGCSSFKYRRNSGLAVKRTNQTVVLMFNASFDWLQ